MKNILIIGLLILIVLMSGCAEPKSTVTQTPDLRTKSKPVEIRLRERGTKKVHIFKGWKETVPAPENKPEWMPDKINKPNVKKVGIEKLKKV